MPSTIYDVAKISGVSISTVSRVLNNNPNVMEDTRQKVLAAIKELHFKPNPIARGLVVKQTNLIEVFFSWEGYTFNFNSSWYTGLLNGFNDVVQQNRYGLLINTIAGVFDAQEVYRKVFNNAVDGVLMVSPYLAEKDVVELADQRIPVILVGYRTQDKTVDFVDSDNVGGAMQAVDHLVSKGHKKIAHISGPVKTATNAADRLFGFKQAMNKHGLTYPENYLIEGDFTRESGREAMGKLLTLPNPPTAVFCADDSMALGAWDEIVSVGSTVGKDVALVGFDDSPECSVPPYSLTTLKQDYKAISIAAANMLFEKIKKPTDWKTQQLSMPTVLVERRSSAGGPKGA